MKFRSKSVCNFLSYAAHRREQINQQIILDCIYSQLSGIAGGYRSAVSKMT